MKHMAQERPDTLIATARIFWRDFAPAWAFPFVFLYGFTAFEWLGFPFWLSVLVAGPCFFWSFFRATRPYIQKRASYWHVVFWGMLIPFIVWILAVNSRIIVARLLCEG